MPFPAMVPVSLAAGTSTILCAALDPSLAGHSGAFLSQCAVWKESLRGHARGKENEEKLWELSERLVGEKVMQ